MAVKDQTPRWQRLIKEVRFTRRKHIWHLFIRGTPIAEIAKQQNLTVEDCRYVMKSWVFRLEKADRKWEAAEAKCRELMIENRQYKLRYDLADKREFSHIQMPMRFRKLFAKKGVTTIGRLRSVTRKDLGLDFSEPAITWAILDLDRRNLTHCLTRIPRAVRRPISETAGAVKTGGTSPA